MSEDSNNGQRNDSRRVLFYALVGTAIGVGLLFFQVVRPFLLPLFLAAVLALLFRPFHESCSARLRGHRHVAAGLVTIVVLLLGLLPLSGALVLAGQELFAAGDELLQVDWRQQPIVADALRFAESYVAKQDWDDWQQSAANAIQGSTKAVYVRTQALLANIVSFIIGLGIVAMGLFYFLAEGPTILQTLQRISPLADKDEAALFEEFGRVCRGVVLASVVCALVQAVLAGIGFAVLGVGRVWLLAGLTMVGALIPFLGAAVIWVPVAAWLAMQGEYAPAVGLIVYGTAVVSSSDNLIRAYVIHGAVNLHPLVALISVLGALRVVGLWGVFIGPIVAAFFYTLLRILHERLNPSDDNAEESL